MMLIIIAVKFAWVSSVDQIDLFKSYSYLIGLWAKKRKEKKM